MRHSGVKNRGERTCRAVQCNFNCVVTFIGVNLSFTKYYQFYLNNPRLFNDLLGIATIKSSNFFLYSLVISLVSVAYITCSR